MGATPDEVSKAYGEPELRHGMTAELPNGRWDYLKDGDLAEIVAPTEMVGIDIERKSGTKT